MRKINLSIIVLIIFLLIPNIAKAEETKIRIFLDGEELAIPGEPFENVGTWNIYSRIMLPLDFISESLGHKVEWNSSTETATIDNRFSITIGRRLIKNSEINYGFNYEPVIKDGKVYAELRLIVQALGYRFDYEKPSFDNDFNYIINLKQKTKPNDVYPSNLVKMNTDVVTPRFTSMTNVWILANLDSIDIPPQYGYPFVDEKGRTMIPLRIIGERLGHKVEWDQSTQTATIDDEISITIGQNLVKTRNGDIPMDTQAIIKDGRTFVPVRFVVEALGYEIDYRQQNFFNRVNHRVDIRKDDLVLNPLNPPIKDGNIYKILTEKEIIELNLDTDVDMYGGIIEERAEKLLAGFCDSIRLEVHENHVKILLYEPEMPTDIGLKYNATISLGMKENSGYGYLMSFYGTNGPSPFVTQRDDGYTEVYYEMDMSLVDNITFTGKVSYNGHTSINYIADLITGQRAAGHYAYLYDW